jgi:prolyl-tRNA editing enzyme YbaK/EbsC (Cys-tRNA(Pro) deacylase)
MRPAPDAVASVSRFLVAARAEARIQEFPVGTPTARDAATAIGCELDQIVKSLLFLCDDRPILAMLPGSRRADPGKIAQAVGATSIRIAPPASVKAATGYEVGGVAPFALPGVERVLVDRALLRFGLVWTGAGSERHMAALAPAELLRLTRAEPVDASAESPSAL